MSRATLILSLIIACLLNNTYNTQAQNCVPTSIKSSDTGDPSCPVLGIGIQVISRTQSWAITYPGSIGRLKNTAEELHTLPQLGVAGIGLDYKESKKRDEHGNLFRYRAKVEDERGTQAGRWAWDVFLVVGSN